MSKIQVNEIVNHFDNGAPDCPKGLTITGVVTATTADFSGNVSIGGTLTYEDVTNIDSVGIITAQSGIVIGTGTSIGNPTTNELGLYTNSSERIRIDSSGKVGIGSITVDSAAKAVISNGGAEGIEFRVGDTAGVCEFLTYNRSGSAYTNLRYDAATHQFKISGNEKARLDSSGRLLIGTSTSPSSGAGNDAIFIVQGYKNNPTLHGIMSLQRGEGAASITSGEEIANINFGDSAGNSFAWIQAFADADAGSGDYPGRLVFATTADSASSPTERMRIRNDGQILINQTAAIGARFGVNVTTNETGIKVDSSYSGNILSFQNSTNASFTGTILKQHAARAATSAYEFISCDSNHAATPDREFTIRGDGNAFADGAWSGGGADYAEYFEWSDGNSDEDDRRGISVVLDGEKIRPAVDGEDPIGVISGNPSVVGDAAWNKWNGKYLRDEYGTYIQEDYEVINDEGETVVQQRRKLNPNYDPDQEYISREDRPEWDCVGLMGKLRIRKGQPTGSRWIKMRDISDSVEEWLVR